MVRWSYPVFWHGLLDRHEDLKSITEEFYMVTSSSGDTDGKTYIYNIVTYIKSNCLSQTFLLYMFTSQTSRSIRCMECCLTVPISAMQKRHRGNMTMAMSPWSAPRKRPLLNSKKNQAGPKNSGKNFSPKKAKRNGQGNSSSWRNACSLWCRNASIKAYVQVRFSFSLCNFKNSKWWLGFTIPASK